MSPPITSSRLDVSRGFSTKEVCTKIVFLIYVSQMFNRCINIYSREVYIGTGRGE